MTERVKNVFVQVGRVSDALSFYSQVLGTEPQFVDGERWAQFKHGGLTVALAGDGEAVGPPGSGWVVTLEVDDLEDATDRAVGAGGMVVARRDMGDHGRAVNLRDPAGNVLTLWTGRSP